MTILWSVSFFLKKSCSHSIRRGSIWRDEFCPLPFEKWILIKIKFFWPPSWLLLFPCGFCGTVPVYNNFQTGTVAVYNDLRTSTVPVYNDLGTGIVPVYNDFQTDTVPVYNFFLKISEYSSFYCKYAVLHLYKVSSDIGTLCCHTVWKKNFTKLSGLLITKNLFDINFS